MVGALGEVLQALTRSNVLLPQVLQIVIERAVELCGADAGDLDVREGDTIRSVAFVGFSPEYEQTVRDLVLKPDRGSVTGRAFLEGRLVQVADVLADPEYQLQDLQRQGGYRTVLAVPLLREGGPLGVLTILRNRVAPFSDHEIRLVALFADQAAIAIHAAALMTETREALETESAVSQVLQSISHSVFQLDQVLQTVIENAVKLSHADYGNILRLDESGGCYRVVAHYGPVTPAFRELVKNTPYTPDRGSLVGRTLLERRPVHIVDVLADPEYRFWEAQRAGGYRTLLGIPMLRDGFVIGVVSLHRTEVRAFSDREISLLITFANQATLAIANVRLYETVERQRTELARFAPQVASLLTSEEGAQLLAGHRREITALFADLRGFTAFAETAEPEEVLGVLRQYHAAVGDITVTAGGTIEHFAGDGLMVFFNDPALLEDHQLAAVRTALAMRERFAVLELEWRKRGYELGLGIGLGVGYATLGRIGFEGRYDYGAIGNVVILASRLSDAAQPGQILISQRLYAAVEQAIHAEPVNNVLLKGMSKPITAFSVLALK
ncbi:MAG TPA: GAF domain-containing protein [Steroidobacteraceae bacterium]|nr:GAF domain-containing protein [Steroidobacteraceae bacterium]